MQGEGGMAWASDQEKPAPDRVGKKERAVLDILERPPLVPGPVIAELPEQTMAVVYTVGNPELAEHRAMAALYSSFLELRRGLKDEGQHLHIGALRVRWLYSEDAPRDKWLGAWGLPVPANVTAMPQVMSNLAVKVETWTYGTVAEIVYEGPLFTQEAALEELYRFMAENDYSVTGAFEEEYEAPPRAKCDTRTFRYRVEKSVLAAVPPTEMLLIDWAFGGEPVGGAADIG